MTLWVRKKPLFWPLSTSNTIVELNMKKHTFLTEDSANLKKRWYLLTMLRAVVFNLPQH